MSTRLQRSRSAFTTLELLFAMVIVGAFLGLLIQYAVGARRLSARTEGKLEAMHSTLVASEVLRGDLDRRVFQRAADLEISRSGSSLSFLVPAPLSDDLLAYRLERVSFFLIAAAGHRYTLVRRWHGVDQPLTDCVLRGMSFSRSPVAGSTSREVLAVCVTGASKSQPEEEFVTSFTVLLSPERPEQSSEASQTAAREHVP